MRVVSFGVGVLGPLVMFAGSARADAPAITKLLDAHVQALTQNQDDDFTATLGDTSSPVIVMSGSSLGSHTGVRYTVWPTKWSTVDLAVEKSPTIVVVDAKKGYAWFHGTVKGALGSRDAANKLTMTDVTYRISGVAAKAGGGWKIAAIQWSAVLPDKDLFARAAKLGKKVTPGKPKKEGDPRVTALVETWFNGGGLAKDQAAVSFVNGTAPGELGANAKATALAKQWDALKMTATDIAVDEIGGGAIYFATVQVDIPQKAAVPMSLGAVIVPDGKTFKWASLNFTTELAKD